MQSWFNIKNPLIKYSINRVKWSNIMQLTPQMLEKPLTKFNTYPESNKKTQENQINSIK